MAGLGHMALFRTYPPTSLPRHGMTECGADCFLVLLDYLTYYSYYSPFLVIVNPRRHDQQRQSNL